MAIATAPEIASLIQTLNASSALGRISLVEASAAFAQMASLGYVLYEPGSTGQTFCSGYNDFDALAMRLRSTTALSRLSNVEVHALFTALSATGYLITRAAPMAQATPVSVTETTTTLAANTPAMISPAAPNTITRFIIANNGTGSLVWKTNSLPTSATDGTPLDPASSAGGQGGSVVLLGDEAISDPIFAWSTAGTTVNVKVG
jgi:hypothetical protein